MYKLWFGRDIIMNPKMIYIWMFDLCLNVYAGRLNYSSFILIICILFNTVSLFNNMYFIQYSQFI